MKYKEEKFIWAHSSRVQSILVEDVWQQELEGAGYIPSSQETETMECSAHFPLFMLSRMSAHRICAFPHLVWLSHIN